MQTQGRGEECERADRDARPRLSGARKRRPGGEREEGERRIGLVEPAFALDEIGGDRAEAGERGNRDQRLAQVVARRAAGR